MTESPATSAQAIREVTFECDLEAPPAKVWRALAEPELRAAWLGEAESAGCEVVEATPPDRLVLLWSLDQPPSLVTFELEERGGGAHLTITHSPAKASVIPLTPRPVRAVMGAWRLAA
jgi:uncharacterized protein YndB with AHSA1/START domain